MGGEKAFEQKKKNVVPRGARAEPAAEAAKFIKRGSIKKTQNMLAAASVEARTMRSSPIELEGASDVSEGAEPFKAWLENHAEANPSDPISKLCKPRILALFPPQGSMHEYVAAMKKTGAPAAALSILTQAFKKYPPFQDALRTRMKKNAASAGVAKTTPSNPKIESRQREADEAAEERSKRISAEVNKKKKLALAQKKRQEIAMAQAKMKEVMAARQAKVDEVEAKRLARLAEERKKKFFEQNPYHQIGQPLPNFLTDEVKIEEQKHYNDLPHVEEAEEAGALVEMKDPALMENIIPEPDYWNEVPEVDGEPKANAQWLADQSKKIRMRNIALSKSDGLGKGDKGYKQEYLTMQKVGMNQPSAQSGKEANKSKNRYTNIVAYDTTRVVLAPLASNDGDYINANWIYGENRDDGTKERYIAAQGPTDQSIYDFWRMIWQEKVEIIVMLTNLVENNKLKCHQYWPDPSSEDPKIRKLFPGLGSISVNFEFQENHQDYVIRRFEVTCKDFPGEVRIVRQFHYVVWPDHGVPETNEEILQFRDTIQEQRKNPDAPLLVHCSAGVGRTGTLIALDRLTKKVSSCSGEINIKALVEEMRMARNFMVQTHTQYQFIHEATVTILTKYRVAVEKLLDDLHEERNSRLDELRLEVEERRREEKSRVEANLKRREDILRDAIHNTASPDHAARVISNFGAGVSSALGKMKKSSDLWKMRQKKAYESWKQDDYDVAFAYTQDESAAKALAMGGRLQK